MYKCCRWCNYFSDGECKNNEDIVTEVYGVDNFIESGILGEVITEAITTQELPEFKHAMANNPKISKKKADELVNVVNSDLKNQYFIEGIIDSVEKAVKDFGFDAVMYPKNENEFICNCFK